MKIFVVGAALGSLFQATTAAQISHEIDIVVLDNKQTSPAPQPSFEAYILRQVYSEIDDLKALLASRLTFQKDNRQNRNPTDNHLSWYTACRNWKMIGYAHNESRHPP
jgi:hypothetical protein